MFTHKFKLVLTRWIIFVVIFLSNVAYLPRLESQHHNDYPSGEPVKKHDILIIDAAHQRSTAGNDTSILLGTFDTLLRAIEQSATSKPDYVKVSAIYTYSDAPTDFYLSRRLRIFRLLRRDLFDQCVGSDSLEKCIIAVKLPTNIPQDDVKSIKNTESFRRFTQDLHVNEEVALLACDSVGRVGFIVPISSNGYSAELYYGQTKDFLPWVRELITNNTARINPASRKTNAGSSRDSRASIGRDDWDHRGSNNQRLVRDQVGGDNRGDSRARVGGDDWDRRGSNNQRLVRDQVGGDSRGDSRARVGGDDWDRRGTLGRGGYNDRGGGGGWGGGVSVAAAVMDLVCHCSCLTLLLVSDTQTY